MNLHARCSRRSFLAAAALGILTMGVAPLPQLALADELASASFDLTCLERQETTVYLPDGSEITMGIVPAQQQGRTSDLGNGTGTWDIYWYNVTVNSGYTIDVRNYNIVAQYGNWYSTIAMQVNECTLYHTSKYCEQRIYYSDAWGFSSDTRVLWGQISGTTLYTGVN